MQPLAIGPGGQTRNSSPVVSYQGPSAVASGFSDQQAGSPGHNQLGTDVMQTVRGTSILSTNQRLTNNSDLIVLMDSDLNIDRSRTSGGRKGFEMSGYVHAYGWSLPASSVKSSGSPSGLDPGQLSGRSSNISAILGGTSSQMTSDSMSQGEGSVSFNRLSGLQVPIPQYCRPLTGDSLGMKIWCATAVDVSGGDYAPVERIDVSSTSPISARDPESSGSVINLSSTPTKPSNQQALRMLEQEVNQALSSSIRESAHHGNTTMSSRMSANDLVQSALPITDDSEDLSSFVWICSTQHSRSKITIIDIKTKPNEKLDSFYISTFLYCIKSIPGFKQSDLLGISSSQDCKDETEKTSLTLSMLNELMATQKRDFYKLVEVDLESQQRLRSTCKVSTPMKGSEHSGGLDMSFEQETQQAQSKATSSRDDDAEISRILDNNISDGVATLQKLNDFVAHIQPQTEEIPTPEPPQELDEADESKEVVYYQPISTHLPTIWMGGKDSVLYIHSAIGQWKDCVACLKLRDSILQICHFRGRVFVALADGSLCVFFRNAETKQWELSQYLIIDIGLMTDATNDSMDPSDVSFTDQRSQNLPQDQKAESDDNYLQAEPETSAAESPTKVVASSPARRHRSKVAGIRCLEIANKNLWVGYKSRVLIIDPITLKLKHTFNVVPQIDNQIRQLISMKDGVFCCLRSDLILRLYSSLKPYQHIQNIDIEPVVTRLISPKTFVISHITAMKVAGNTLWIGNAHGIIITIPCKLLPQVSEAPVGSAFGEHEESTTSLSIARFVPKCDISNAQVSFSTLASFESSLA